MIGQKEMMWGVVFVHLPTTNLFSNDMIKNIHVALRHICKKKEENLLVICVSCVVKYYKIKIKICRR